MAGALDRDYSRSQAILIGTWEYTTMRGPIPAVRNSLDRMAALLTGELCGWPAGRVTTIPNERKPGDLPDRITEIFGKVRDVALFYYVGHGQSDPDDKLCLGLVDSLTEAKRRATTSLEFEDIRRALKNSDASTKIVILDCCFAGLAIHPDGKLAEPDLDVAQLAGGTGAFTMAASGYTTAWYEIDGQNPQTYFTKHLADIVERGGIPHEPAGLRLTPIFKQLRNSLEDARKPRPTGLNHDFAGEYVFARNAAGLPATPLQSPPPSDFETTVGAPPSGIAKAVTKLRRASQDVEADRLLAAVPARRSGQEIAALVSLLRSGNWDADIEVIIGSAVDLPRTRSPSCCPRCSPWT
jgi:caspase domain-containing protein